MKHPTYDPSCGICKLGAGETPVPGGVVYEDDLWLIRHAPPPYGVPGWMTLQSQRHVQGIAHFDDAEAARFGTALRHFERVLEDVTGAVRICTVSMNESFPHFHAHLVPRYAQMPKDARGYAVYALQQAAGTGEIQVHEAEVARLTTSYREALATSPPPR
ncbi:MAG: HIT family protein [Chloroflexota bacterium]|nr:HIT family protein [Chloroflexota bacterium]